MRFADIIEKDYNDMLEKTKFFLNVTSYFIENTINKNDENILVIYNDDNKNKKICSIVYEIMGIYDANCNIFSW